MTNAYERAADVFITARKDLADLPINRPVARPSPAPRSYPFLERMKKKMEEEAKRAGTFLGKTPLLAERVEPPTVTSAKAALEIAKGLTTPIRAMRLPGTDIYPLGGSPELAAAMQEMGSAEALRLQPTWQQVAQALPATAAMGGIWMGPSASAAGVRAGQLVRKAAPVVKQAGRNIAEAPIGPSAAAKPAGVLGKPYTSPVSSVRTVPVSIGDNDVVVTLRGSKDGKQPNSWGDFYPIHETRTTQIRAKANELLQSGKGWDVKTGEPLAAGQKPLAEAAPAAKPQAPAAGTLTRGASIEPGLTVDEAYRQAKVSAARGQLAQVRQVRQSIAEPAGVAKPLSVAPTPAQAPVQPPARVVPQPAAPPQVAAGGAQPPQKPPTSVMPPTGGPEPEFAANIRLTKYPQDVRGDIWRWANEHPLDVETARRGVRPDVEVLADAKKLAEQTGGRLARLEKRWKAGQAWNAEEVLAIRGVLRKRTEDVMKARELAVSAPSAQNQLAFASSLLEQARIQEIVHGVTAESGRALRSFRQVAFEATKATNVEKMEELLRRLGGKERIPAIADALGRLDLDDPVAVNAFIRATVKPKLSDKLFYVYINSILAGPKTHIINEGTNLLTAGISPVERGLAAAVERPLAAIQRRPVQRFMSEVPADAIGAIQGLSEGVRAAIYMMRHGMSPGQASKWEFRARPIGGVAGRVIGVPTDMLEAADVMNRSINYSAALSADAARQARAMGFRGQAAFAKEAELLANPTDDMILRASALAEYRLFRAPAGDITKAIMRIREVVPGLQYIIPFIRTPVNILKFGLERSPAGLLNPTLYHNLAKKNPAAADQIARMMLGSAVGGAIAWYFGAGRLTGSVPRNAAERDRFYREGKQPFSMKIGDRWVQYQRMEPYNLPISLVSTVVDAVDADDKTVEDKAQQAAFTIAQNITSQTYLSSLSDLLNFLSDPERYGRNFGQWQAGGFVPFSSALRTATQMMDPTIRAPSGFPEYVKSNLPVLSENVPPRLTAFGEEAQRQSPAWSPIAISKAQEDAVDAELGRLGVEIGFVGDSIGGRKLTREQQQEYQASAGQAVKVALVQLIGTNNYRWSTDDQKETKVTNTRDRVRDVVRARLVRAWGPTPSQRWRAISMLMSGTTLQALLNLWSPRKTPLPPVEEQKLRAVFAQFPLEQTNFNTWLKQTLRQLQENATVESSKQPTSIGGMQLAPLRGTLQPVGGR